MIVFDVTKLETFNNIPKWMQEIEHNTNTSIQKILVGNKSDLIQERTGMIFIEVMIPFS
jgi:GTPase SAR1 family protein